MSRQMLKYEVDDDDDLGFELSGSSSPRWPLFASSDRSLMSIQRQWKRATGVNCLRGGDDTSIMHSIEA